MSKRSTQHTSAEAAEQPAKPIKPENYIYADFPVAPLWRRLIAVIYDGLLLIAIWLAVSAALLSLYQYVFHAHWGWPMDSFHNIPDVRPPSWYRHGVIFPCLILASWGFYAWFWRHGGQTLGMQAWKLMARDTGKKPMTVKQTVIRFFAGWISTFGFGLGWLIAIRGQKGTLHDRLSNTEVIVVPKAK